MPRSVLSGMEREPLSRALRQPRDAVVFEMSRLLKERRPGSAVVLTREGTFGLDAFARDGRCELSERAGETSVLELEEREEVWTRKAIHAWREVRWEGEPLEVVTLTHAWSSYESPSHWVIAASSSLAERFIQEVCRHSQTVTDSLLVFEGGAFTKSAALYASIQQASFDALVLPARLRADLEADLRRFTASRALYARHRIPWKRGLLLIGPPGNGKTCALQAMIKEAALPALYVKTFKSDRDTEEQHIREVFTRARALAPALIVLEDIDSHISELNRSVFLNELDGFSRNEGLVVLASTNHPERLDPSLLDRPSRFDRKYHFPLPERAERLTYLARWSEQLDPETQLSGAALERLADRTGGFTFAYLKELSVSSLMAWADGGGGTSMDLVAERVLRGLRQELESATALVPRISPGRRIGVQMESEL